MPVWHPYSWQSYPLLQQPVYPSQPALDDVTQQLATLPPIVTSSEIVTLKSQLRDCVHNKAFLLQGGDCAERFSDCSEQRIKNLLKILLQMSLVMLEGLRKPIVRVGRMAGQYAKPRSDGIEIRDHEALPSYRGDMVNQAEFTLEKRTPNPENLLKGYHYSALTLNYVRALVESGFADLSQHDQWQLEYAGESIQRTHYQQRSQSVNAALQLMQACTNPQQNVLERGHFFTSHEALLLPYEAALTRKGSDDKWYNLSTHFPWVGMRTSDPANGHVEYLRGIHNPIAVKLGPDISPDELKRLLHLLNPENEAGRLTLITRFGLSHIHHALPPLIQAVQEESASVLWSCDPMHGNTLITMDGRKTRYFDHILSEVQQAFQLLQDHGTHLGGVHFELTADKVTECVGGQCGLQEQDLHRAYKSLVDPRLNYEQALEIVARIVECATGRKEVALI